MLAYEFLPELISVTFVQRRAETKHVPIIMFNNLDVVARRQTDEGRIYKMTVVVIVPQYGSDTVGQTVDIKTEVRFFLTTLYLKTEAFITASIHGLIHVNLQLFLLVVGVHPQNYSRVSVAKSRCLVK